MKYEIYHYNSIEWLLQESEKKKNLILNSSERRRCQIETAIVAPTGDLTGRRQPNTQS